MQQVIIRVRGLIDESWSEWLGGLALTANEHGETVLTGQIADGSALYGIIARLRDLGLPLQEVKCEDVAQNQEEGQS